MVENAKSFQDENQEISIHTLIDSLIDLDNPFPTKYLYRLSDLGREDHLKLDATWPKVDPSRRLGVIEDLETLAESNTLVSFDSVFKLGLTDEFADIRQTSIRALWECEDTSLIPRFIELLQNDPVIQVKAQAASGLGHFVLLGEMGKIQEKHHKEVVKSLLGQFDSETPELVRQYALESLGFSSHQKVPGLIEDGYDSEDEDWLASALIAMGRSDDDQWHPHIIDNLDHSDVKVRHMATQAAGMLAIEDAVPMLIHALNDEDDEVQMAAVWSLSEIGGDDVRTILEELLEDTEDEDLLEIIDNALENLIFNENLDDFGFMDFSQNMDEENSDPAQDEE